MSASCQDDPQRMLEYQDELDQVDAELASVELSLQELLETQSELTRRRSELVKRIEHNTDQKKQQKDAEFWNKTDFPWTKAIDEKLKSVFKLTELRPMQRQTMNATLSGDDCLLIMPTGGGKSLCFQLPAVIKIGLTLVISPLVSLMEDQQMALEQLDIPSAILNASSSKEMQKFVLDDMVNPKGSLRLLYVTPEKLAKSKRFMNKLEKCYSIGHLSRLVIDEVHCCSQWGHDFRPDYKFLGIMKRQFPTAPILGLTATATTRVLDDVRKILNIPKALVLKASFNRPNLFYQVREKPSSQKESIEAIVALIKGTFNNQSGIVYCFSRKESEEVAMELSSRGIEAGCYHADIDAKSRSQVHRKWLDGDLQVVVATVAFGMGIDKANVRFVIHHSISKSMENLYQESGRAGRDGQRSECIVFYRLADVVRQSSMVFTEQTGLTNLHGIVKYCIDVSTCRRCVIADHFGEVWDGAQCKAMCDLCLKKQQGGVCETRDVTRHCVDVLAILEAAASSNQRVTAIKLIDAWYGKGAPGLKLKSVKAPSLAKPTAERILAHLLVNDFLREDFHFTAYSTICYLVPGSKAKLIRNKTAKVFLDFTTGSSSSKSKGSDPQSKSNHSSPSPSSSSSTSASKQRLDSSTSSPSSTQKDLGRHSSDKPKLVGSSNKEQSSSSSSSLSSKSGLNKEKPSSSSSTSSSKLINKEKPSSSSSSSSPSSKSKLSLSSSSSLSDPSTLKTKPEPKPNTPGSTLMTATSVVTVPGSRSKRGDNNKGKKQDNGTMNDSIVLSDSDEHNDNDLNFDDDDDFESESERKKVIVKSQHRKRSSLSARDSPQISSSGDKNGTFSTSVNGSRVKRVVKQTGDADTTEISEMGSNEPSDVENSSGDIDDNGSVVTEKRRKRKRGVIISSSSGENSDGGGVLEERSSRSIQDSSRLSLSRTAGKRRRKTNGESSILISDEEEEDENETINNSNSRTEVDNSDNGSDNDNDDDSDFVP